MPLYSYICQDCGEKFDLLIGVNVQKPDFKCEKCNSTNITKVYAAFSTGKSGSKSSSLGSNSCPTGTCNLG